MIFIELVEKMLVSAKLPTDSLASIKLISQNKLCCTFNTKALASQFISARKIIKSSCKELSNYFIRSSIDNHD